MKNCKHCSSSGIYIDYQPTYDQVAVPCKYCQGKGYIDEEEVISVPRKFVKDEYYQQ